MNEKRILSTKKLTVSQRELLLHAGVAFVEYDAISIEPLGFSIPSETKNAIFTSQNGVRVFFNQDTASIQPKLNCFCVGRKTKALLEENEQKVVFSAENASVLADFIAKNHQNESFYYFCGKSRRDELPNRLKEARIPLFEIKTYETKLNYRVFDQKWDGILFFSPSGVESYIKGRKEMLAQKKDSDLSGHEPYFFCIGDTTAAEARKYGKNVVIANTTTIESVIAKAVNTLRAIET